MSGRYHFRPKGIRDRRKLLTPEQIAASAAVGELRTQQSFGGDTTQAWNTHTPARPFRG